MFFCLPIIWLPDVAGCLVFQASGFTQKLGLSNPNRGLTIPSSLSDLFEAGVEPSPDNIF